VIHVVGSRGDIQPFLAIGKSLKEHEHRVRLATHLAFKSIVLENELEFFCIGGDPVELMAFMVKNPGLLPRMSTIRSGSLKKRRGDMKTIVEGCWKSCFEASDVADLGSVGDVAEGSPKRPFVADVIIANPPSMAHVHCAEKLGIPFHMMFT
jgi:UDP:flavonoid glycosyltransferase YjiC (YdhE family)